MDQQTLFDSVTETAGSGAPRCRMCARPARWLAGQLKWSMYCGGRHCDNRQRICQRCDKAFHFNVDGAGTKYCSDECKAAGYGRSVGAAQPKPSVRCAWCGRAAPAGSARQRPDRAWPYICATCLDPIRHVVDRLKAHRVPHTRARQLVAESGCEICGTDLLAKVKPDGRGKVRAELVVDHDHRCCPAGSHSCGRCVRGLLCYRCNSAAGMLLDSADNARALAKYLEIERGRDGTF